MSEKLFEVLGLEFVHPREPRPVKSYKVKIETIGHFPTEELAVMAARRQGFGNTNTNHLDLAIIADRKKLAGWFVDTFHDRDTKRWVMHEVVNPETEARSVQIINTYLLPHPRFPSMTRQSVARGGLGI